MTNQTYFYYLIVKLTIVATFSIVTFVLGTYRVVKAIQHFVRSVKSYRLNKAKFFRDNREQQRMLYNYETHIVKDIILIILCLAEIGEAFVITMNGIWGLSSENTSKFYPSKKGLTLFNCSKTKTWHDINHVAINLDFLRIWEVFNYSFCSIGYIVFLLLLSFLTEYLSRRYFQHRYFESLVRHLIILAIEISVMLILTNLELITLQLLIAPIFILIDWCILVKNSRHLHRVLKSNVRDLDLHFTHRNLYREQRHVLKIYTIFMPIFLAALFFGVLFFLFHNYMSFVIILIETPCIQGQIGSENWDYTSTNNVVNLLNKIALFGSLALLEFHFFLQGLPLYFIPIEILYSACIKRRRMMKQKTRFGYTDFPHLFGRYK